MTQTPPSTTISNRLELAYRMMVPMFEVGPGANALLSVSNPVWWVVNDYLAPVSSRFHWLRGSVNLVQNRLEQLE
jgi:hypothetical protein